MVLNKIHIDKNVADMLASVIPSSMFDLCTRAPSNITKN